jgi:hypothetical protein
MRSPVEIAWRLRQEAANLWLLLRPPQAPLIPYAPLSPLPAPEALAARLRGSAFLAELDQLARRILSHRFPLLGLEIQTGSEIAWRRDYVRGIETPKRYFRRIPYLDPGRAGDHKLVWELNRHQHLVVLAQAWLGTEDGRYLEEICSQLESWWRDNPFHRGINWASALEVAFRALSWTWVYHLAGGAMPDGVRHRLLTSLLQHACHLEWNLSVYFSPNTHLLIEAVALHALGLLFPALPGAERRRRQGAYWVLKQMEAQVRGDGSHFEQSSYYHVYALDAFLFHAVLEETPPSFRGKTASMARFLAALLGPARELPFLGDDDGGRFFHPYGPRSRFARASIATASALLDLELPYEPEELWEQAFWWLGPGVLRRTARPPRLTVQSQLFPDAGLAVLGHGGLQAIVDAGPFGPGSAGHSHSDTLSLVVRSDEDEVLIDPGTYTYVDPVWRDRFRGSAAHNTVRIDGLDQAIPAGPFRWRDVPRAELIQFAPAPEHDFVDAVCSWRGVRHRRRILLLKDPCWLLILDEVELASDASTFHLIEQFWHLGQAPVLIAPHSFRIGRQAALVLAGAETVELSEGGEYGWRSPAPGFKLPAPLVRATVRAPLPVRLAALLSFTPQAPGLQLVADPDGCRLLVKARSEFSFRFARDGGWRLLSP